MASYPLHFLLVGNGPYANRGCEAIARGTIAILRREFGSGIRVTVASFRPSALIADQMAAEHDPAIAHVSLSSSLKRWRPIWWARKIDQYLHTNMGVEFRPLRRPAKTAYVALQVGGDNYSLDYGIPYLHMALDRFLWHAHVPLCLWGASVGPFSAEPAIERRMFRHLRRMDAILVRETISHGYLRDHGLIRLHRVADPAFAMDPTPPAGVNAHITIPNGAIGVNLSPLMASYVTGGNIITWERQCADIIRSIADATRRPIVLVPHVMTPNGDDHSFLVRVASLFSAGAAPVVLPRDLSAAELKYLISRCVVFAGARTHSTIAGLSSLVPTLSFAYSIKAYGLNQDIYGSQEFCLKPGELTPSVVTERLVFMLANCKQIRARLADRLPDVIADAYKAGPVLREALEARGY